MLTAAICHPTVSDGYVIITLDARPRHMHTGYFLHFPPFYLEIGSVVLGCVCILAMAEDLSLFPVLGLKVDQSRQLQSENSTVEITVCSPPMEFSVVFCFSLACLFCFSLTAGLGQVFTYSCGGTLYKVAFIFPTCKHLLTSQVSPKILHAVGLESDGL